MIESSHIYDWVMSRIHLFHSPTSKQLCATTRVMSHIWMGHVTHIHKIYGWVMSHMWMGHVTRMDETRGWVMSHTWMSHVTHMHESCHTYECDISDVWKRHVTHMNASCHIYLFQHQSSETRYIYKWVMSQMWISHATHTCQRVMT